MYDVDAIKNAVINALKSAEMNNPANNEIKVGVSQRHIHLSREHQIVMT